MSHGNQITIATQFHVPAAQRVVTESLQGKPSANYVGNIGHIHSPCLIYLIGEHVVAFSSVLTKPGDGRCFWDHFMPYIGFIGVLPDFQHRGIGTSLLRATCDLVFDCVRAGKVYLNCEHKLDKWYSERDFELVPKEEVEKRWPAPIEESTFCRRRLPQPKH